MDPLTALGLASNVFACISFAWDLVRSTVEISTSTHGCSADTLRLDSVYKQLSSLYDGLESCILYSIPHGASEGDDEDDVKNITNAIKSLSAVCKGDCDELLQVIANLKTKDGARGKLISFGTALRMAWKKTKIDELENKLSKTQRALTVHICTLAAFASRAQSDRVENMQRQSLILQTDHAKALCSLKKELDLFMHNSKLQKELLNTRDIDFLQKGLKSISLSEAVIAQEQLVLRSLSFDSRPIRHTQIAEAHEETFRWALNEKTDQNGSLGIREWLEHGDGIVWISGKPGSGKWTLMKFIADSPITSQLVTKWASRSKAIIASHYFWIAGTPMQKSYQGLLQTLLYGIFRQSPPLIRRVCAERWASAHPAKSWSLLELFEALKGLTRNTPDLKICFFIDGMDEYSGDHDDRIELCQVFKGLATSDNVKICLASRPWNVFEEAFGSDYPKLYVQDLTRGDIEAYAESRLREHPRWDVVSAKHANGQWLVSEITAKSEGVFLWVYIVTKLLRESLTNRDGWFELHRRLQSFPSELESFFKTILESVQPFYHSHMSTALQIAVASGEDQLDFLTFHFHDQEYGEADYAIDIPVRLMEKEDMAEIQSNTSWHLDSRTHGLLEVNAQYGTVNFLHRTARDFLCTQEMREFLAAKVDKGLNFNPLLSILKALIAIIKGSSVPSQINRTEFGKYETTASTTKPQHVMLRLLWDALKYARKLEIDASHDSRHHLLLNELDRSLLCLLSSNDCILSPPALSRVKQAILREQMVDLGLFDYLHRKLDSDPTFLADIGSLPLQRFLGLGQAWSEPPQTGPGIDALVSVLKGRGVYLNRADLFHTESPWIEFLLTIGLWLGQKRGRLEIFDFLLDEGILMLLLKAGADPNAKLLYPGILVPGLPPGERRIKTAAVVYAEFCFQFLDQSHTRQELYLGVFREFIRLSTFATVRAVCNTFITALTDLPKIELAAWNLPFLSRINDSLLQSLSIGGSYAMEIKVQQDAIARQVFPRELYTPMQTAASSNRGKGKRKSESGNERQKKKRKL